MSKSCCDNHNENTTDCCSTNTTPAPQSGENNNPVLVNVTRGGIVESKHRGSIAVVDVNGTTQMSFGDIKSVVYPRSSVKIFQALPMVLSGAVEKYNLTAEELSVCCASHGGEVRHTKVVNNILQKAGLTVDDLECGSHKPTHNDSADSLIKQSKKFNPLHNNCSGKHAGMLLLAKMNGFDTKGYTDPQHPVQQTIMGCFESIFEYSLENSPFDRDGCSAPTWALPLQNLAYGFAKVSDPYATLPEPTARAITSLRDSVIQEPFMVGGTNRACSRIMEVLQNKAFVKFGAEAVYTASLTEYGLGIAIKIDDGSTRAVEVALISVLDKIGVLSDTDKQQLEKFYRPAITNWNGFTVGHTESAF